MSRIGKLPVQISAGVSVEVSGSTVTVKGPKGELNRTFGGNLAIKVEDNQVTVAPLDQLKTTRSMHGTARSIIQNMVSGVSQGYLKELEIHGVGFKGELQGREVVLHLGFAHEIRYTLPEGVEIEIKNNGTDLALSGPDNQQVGQAAAQIRSYYKAEPYKGKGVRYKNEQIRRKVGKAVA